MVYGVYKATYEWGASPCSKLMAGKPWFPEVTVPVFLDSQNSAQS